MDFRESMKYFTTLLQFSVLQLAVTPIVCTT